MTASTANLELDVVYIKRALGIEQKDWVAPGSESANTKSQPLPLPRLKPVFRFADHGEYLAHVLGSHRYEDVESKSNVFKYFNGEHRVDIYRDESKSMRHLILLNIRAPDAAPGESLPEYGERVLVNITMTWALGEESWTGHVIRVPSALERLGRNVAIIANRPSVPGGQVLNHERRIAQLLFGASSGQSTVPLRQKLIKAMAGGDSFWKSWLLAQDNLSLDNIAHTDDLPIEWKQKVNEACTRAQLNKEQTEAVHSYFKHKITIVAGPPGTGKSKLVGVVLDLEEQFGNQYWACTESNASIDFLARKLRTRPNTASPDEFFRIRAMLDQRLLVDVDHGQATGHHALPSAIPTQTEPRGVISKCLEEADEELASYPLSLETTVLARMVAVLEQGVPKIFEAEDAILRDLKDTINQVVSLTQDRNRAVTDEAIEIAQKAETTAHCHALNRLIVLQGVYIKKSRGIFSTVAATSSPLLARFAPHGLIVDDASHIDEAHAVHSILQAADNGNLRRVLIIGDQHQHSPTMTAKRNPFASTGSISLMERQILAGTPHIQLRMQYRMHPSISQVVRHGSYGGYLLDARVTTQRLEVAQFKDFVMTMAANSGMSTDQTRRLDTCSLIFSPSPFPTEFPHFGSQVMPGSESRYNLQTAMMVFRTVYWLVKVGRYKPQHILVTAFYAAQVSLLRALFHEETVFNGIRLGKDDGVKLSTVDDSQGEENMVQIVDCVNLGSAANESIGSFVGDRRRFNVAMSRGQVGRIVICSTDFIEGRCTSSAWKGLLEDPRAVKLADTQFRSPWEGESAALLDKFLAVRKDWVASAQASKEEQVAHRNMHVASWEMEMVKGIRWSGP